jgi:hypothetical protein
MNATDRFKILSNIVAQKGTDNVDLYAELAKAESMVNLMDTQKAMSTSANMAQVGSNMEQPTQPTTPPEVTPM